MKKTSSDFTGQPAFHQPVLLNEVCQYLNIKTGKVYLDATLGGGGHAGQILKKGGRVFGLDRDPEAVNFCVKHLTKIAPKDQWQVVQENFCNLEKIALAYKIKPAGILFDLGVSLHQLKTKGRGFSFAIDEPLDMRMDPDLSVTAADLVNGLHKGELYELFSKLGEEKLALPIAKAVILERQTGAIRTTGQLADIVCKIYYRYYRERSKIHPATKVFQALRIAVNDELNNLKTALDQAGRILEPLGRLVVICFHRLEDKIVKEYFLQNKEAGWLKVITQKPIIPTEAEISLNPRSRSAKLRCAEKK